MDGLTFSQPNNTKYNFNAPATNTLNVKQAVQSGGLKVSNPVQSGSVLGASTAPAGSNNGTPINAPANNPQNIVPQVDSGAINGLFDSSNNYLNDAESTLRGNFPSVLAEADATYNTNKSVLDSNNQDAMAQFGIQGEQVDKRGLEAKAANSRLYSDLNRGYQQRFGGSSSAGQAASEIANVEQQRQQGQISRGLADTHQQIDQQKTQVDHEYKNNLLQLEQNKQLAVSNATRDFQNKLLEISKARADLGVNKAQANLQAMQDYRNKVFQINVQNMQYAQTLDQQRQQSQLSLDNYKQQLATSMSTTGNAINGFNSGAGTVDPTTGLQVNNNTQTANPSASMTGQISNNQQKQIIGFDAQGNPVYSQ